MLTLDQLKDALPAQLKGSATQSLLDKVNQCSSDPDMARAVADNFVTHTSVLLEGRSLEELGENVDPPAARPHLGRRRPILAPRALRT